MNLLTIIVLAYLVVVMANAFRRGFIRTLFSMIFFILVLATTAWVSPMVTNVLEESENVSAYVKEQSDRLVEEQAASYGSIDDAESSADLALAIVGSALQINGVKTIASEEIGDLILKMLGLVATFILSVLFWWLIEFVLNRVARIGFLSPVNRILGLFLGFVKGLFVVWIAFGVIYVLQFTATGKDLLTQIEMSPVLSAINQANFLMSYIPNILLSLFL